MESILNKNTYDLHLPTVDCPDNLEIKVDGPVLYKGSFKVSNLGEGQLKFFLASDLHLMKLDQQVYEGNEVYINFSLDLREVGEFVAVTKLTGHIYLYFLGGEKKIPIRIQVESKEQSRQVQDVALKVQTPTLVYPKTKPFKWYFTKGSYERQDTAKLIVVKGPVKNFSASVSIDHKALLIEPPREVMPGMLVFSMRLMPSLFEFITSRKEIITKKTLSLKITYNDEVISLPIEVIFTSLGTKNFIKKTLEPSEVKGIKIQALKLYLQYTLTSEMTYLDESMKLLSKMLAYDPASHELRLYYLLTLIEKGKIEEAFACTFDIKKLLATPLYHDPDVKEEIESLLRHVLKWFEGERGKRWPTSSMGFLFSYRLEEIGHVSFRQLENRYEAGDRSIWLFAAGAALQNIRPTIPASKGPFYRALLHWAYNHGVLKGSWLSFLESNAYYLIKYKMVTSNFCWILYTEFQSQGLLKLLTSLYVEEEAQTYEAFLIYQAALEEGIYIKNLQSLYIKTASNLLEDVDLALINMAVVLPSLPGEVQSYLLRQYLERQVESQNFPLFRRQLLERLEQLKDRPDGENGAWLLRYEMERLLDKHQGLEAIAYLSEAMMDYIYDQASLGERLVEAAILHKDWRRLQLFESGWIMNHVSDDLFNTYVTYLISIDQVKRLVNLYWLGGLYRLDETSLLMVLRRLLTYNETIASQVAWYYWNQGKKHSLVLECIIKNPYREVRTMLEVLADPTLIGDRNASVVDLILQVGALTRLHARRTIDLFMTYWHIKEDFNLLNHLLSFIIGQVLIEENYGYGLLLPLFESLIYHPKYKDNLPIQLTYLKLQALYGEKNDPTLINLLKKVVNNGIIFPWLEPMAAPFIKQSSYRKTAIFTYHGEANLTVVLHYYDEASDQYHETRLRHVGYGFYVGYIIVFYLDYIAYYFEERSLEGLSRITESNLYLREDFIEPLMEPNGYDTINTIIMSQHLDDEDSVNEVSLDYIEIRRRLREQLSLL